MKITSKIIKKIQKYEISLDEIKYIGSSDKMIPTVILPHYKSKKSKIYAVKKANSGCDGCCFYNSKRSDIGFCTVPIQLGLYPYPCEPDGNIFYEFDQDAIPEIEFEIHNYTKARIKIVDMS